MIPKPKKKHATTFFDEDGFDYRSISQVLTELGWKMNHTSVRNYILRSMSKFAEAYCDKVGIPATSTKIEEISRDPNFQSFVGDMLFKTLLRDSK